MKQQQATIQALQEGMLKNQDVPSRSAKNSPQLQSSNSSSSVAAQQKPRRNELILELVDDMQDLQQQQPIKPLNLQPLPLKARQNSFDAAMVQNSRRKLSSGNRLHTPVLNHTGKEEPFDKSAAHQRSRSADLEADQLYIKQRLSNGQIELCGYLSRPFVQKNASNNNNILASTTWKKLWFELRKDNKLLYYESRDSQKPLASIPLDNFYIRISKELYPEHCCFELVTYNFIYQFIAGTRIEMERWMEALKRKSVQEAENNLIGKAEESIMEAEKQKSSFVQTYGENSHLRLRYYQQLLKPSLSVDKSPQGLK